MEIFFWNFHIIRIDIRVYLSNKIKVKMTSPKSFASVLIKNFIHRFLCEIIFYVCVWSKNLPLTFWVSNFSGRKNFKTQSILFLIKHTSIWQFISCRLQYNVFQNISQFFLYNSSCNINISAKLKKHLTQIEKILR